MSTIILGVLTGYILLFAILLVFICREIHLELMKKRKLLELESYSNIYNSLDSFEGKLNEFIVGIIDEYMMIHSDIFNDYISESKQKEIIFDINKDILKYMSPTLISQLNIIYNTNFLNEIINRKITLAVVAKVVETNSIATINN